MLVSVEDILPSLYHLRAPTGFCLHYMIYVCVSKEDVSFFLLCSFMLVSVEDILVNLLSIDILCCSLCVQTLPVIVSYTALCVSQLCTVKMRCAFLLTSCPSSSTYVSRGCVATTIVLSKIARHITTWFCSSSGAR